METLYSIDKKTWTNKEPSSRRIHDFYSANFYWYTRRPGFNKKAWQAAVTEVSDTLQEDPPTDLEPRIQYWRWE